MAAKFKTLPESKDLYKDVFPVGGKIRTWITQKSLEHSSAYKLTKKDLFDYRIALDVLVEFSECLKPTKNKLKAVILSAVGVDVDNFKAKIDWEHFMKLNTLLKYNNASAEDYITFIVHLFDPHESSYTRDVEFERIIDLMFVSSEKKD